MMKHKNGRALLLAALGSVLLLALTACSRQQAPDASLPAADVPPAVQAQPEAEAPQAAEPELSEPAVPAEPAEPEAPARTVSYAMLLDGTETTVYPEVSDAEIIFWDSAAGGQIAAVAKFAQAMPGAADALQSCDFTDLDGDGNSDLIVTKGNPLDDLRALRNVDMVMARGRLTREPKFKVNRTVAAELDRWLED